MKKYIAYAVLTGLLLSLAWPSYGFPLLVFVGFVPLLLAEHQLTQRPQYQKKGIKIFALSFLSFLIWNAIVIWWLHYAKQYNAQGELANSWIAYLIPVFANTLLMSVVFLLFHWVKKTAGNLYGMLFLPAVWMAFEKFHLNWEMTWPWFNLGNVFAEYYQWVQWYEFTGTFGGTLWVLIVNLIVFYYYTAYHNKKDVRYLKKLGVYAGLWIAIPIGISYAIYTTYEEQGDELEAVVLQPALDPYTEKYQKDRFTIYQELIELTDGVITENTQFVVGPETAIPGSGPGFVLDKIYDDAIIQQVEAWVKQHPKVNFVTGAELMRIYPLPELATETASLYPNTLLYYDAFNSAIQLNVQDSIQFYHKSKLVVGVEHFPYRKFLKPIIGEMMLNFGGTMKTLGTQPEPSVFKNSLNKAVVAPVICYESIFGEYLTQYAKKGANVIFTMTNDSWWEDTEGHKQLLLYGNLRAIELRKPIVRSANSGISAFVNQRGDVVDFLPYGMKGALKGNVKMNEKLTFYAKFGDYIARVGIMVMGIILAYTLLQILLFKRK
ncbi:apolipoprotein N-acyltransferase [Vaginella massiliensis]|uniref:apolipoprotein N-acyltransferase n=1 Tax=Vaginella massiliensis TaxID=1816680 RepID=UPI0037539A1A